MIERRRQSNRRERAERAKMAQNRAADHAREGDTSAIEKMYNGSASYMHGGYLNTAGMQ